MPRIVSQSDAVPLCVRILDRADSLRTCLNRQMCFLRIDSLTEGAAHRTLQRKPVSFDSWQFTVAAYATGQRPGDPCMEAQMARFNSVILVVPLACLIMIDGCQELIPRDIQSLLFPGLRRSEVFGFIAGLGTTFAALPDLIVMLKRRSSASMNPRMAAIIGVFQILWVYYGLLIVSRPVVLWNVIGVFINFLSVGAYLHFSRKDKSVAASRVQS